MKTSRLLVFAALAVLAFGMGAGLAIWKNKADVPAEAALTVAADAPATEETAVTDMPAADVPAPAPEMAAGEVVPGAPAMPEAPLPADIASADGSPADTAAVTAAEEPVMAGVQVGGDFALTDFDGKAVTAQSWPGRHLLIFFGFTHCPDICPVLLDRLTALLNDNPAAAAQIQPLLITTDPERDTPEALKTYLSGYHASLVGLTGTVEEIEAVKATYKVYAAKGDAHEGQEGYDMNHSSYVYLMSPDLKPLEIISANVSAEEMAAKIMKHMPATELAPAPTE